MFKNGHNPCFSGNSFAILMNTKDKDTKIQVTILVLVETPLQSDGGELSFNTTGVTILVLVETPLQFW